MGSPQGTVLVPVLFTIDTAGFFYNSANLRKFSDDSAIGTLIVDGGDGEYKELTQECVDWCQWNHLQINNGKTK